MIRFQPPPPVHPYPWYTPRFWSGMRLGTWLALLARNRFAIHPLRWPMAVGVASLAAASSVLSAIQGALFGGAIGKTELAGPPLVIVGHWRSGTTYLHELLSLDERFATPTTYQVYFAGHFLLTERFARRFLWWILPRRRPMDNVEIGLDSPQEDEWALCTLGVPSPYLRVAFPNRPPPFEEYLDMDSLSPAELVRWQSALELFLKAVTKQSRKRLILKSPHHTGRIHVLRKLFPGAKFIHMVRNPHVMLPSAVRMWQAFDLSQGMQLARGEQLADYVLATGPKMYASFDRHRAEFSAGELADIRYEDLVHDSLGELERIYQQLDLGDFEQVRPRLAAYAESRRNYQTNRHDLPDDFRQAIDQQWACYRERYGYADEWKIAPPDNGECLVKP